jgi:hypothetical protein
MPSRYRSSCDGLKTGDQLAAEKAENEKAAAEQALAVCQFEIDAKRLDDAKACWENSASKIAVLGVAADGVPACLANARTPMKNITSCVTQPENTDDEVIAKATCLAAFEAMTLKCGPLDLQKVHAELEANLDVARLKQSLDDKAKPIIARRDKLMPRGWQDVTLDANVIQSVIARGTCKTEEEFKTCTVCRDRKLAFPCMEVSFADGKLIEAVSFERSKSYAADEEQQLEADWGPPTAVESSPNAMACWDRGSLSAALVMRNEAAQKSAGTIFLMVGKPPSMCATATPQHAARATDPDWGTPAPDSTQRVEATAEAWKRAKADAKRKACGGNNVLAVVAKLQIGNDLDPRLMKDCAISVPPGRVVNTTRDGWMLVRWGDDLVAAFRTRKAHVDGSFFRTSATATYLGLQQFTMVDGGNATLATFKLSE